MPVIKEVTTHKKKFHYRLPLVSKGILKVSPQQVPNENFMLNVDNGDYVTDVEHPELKEFLVTETDKKSARLVDNPPSSDDEEPDDEDEEEEAEDDEPDKYEEMTKAQAWGEVKKRKIDKKYKLDYFKSEVDDMRDALRQDDYEKEESGN